MNDMKKSILNKIEHGEVAMRPHWQFVLQGVALITAAVFAVGALVYVASFVLYILQWSGAVYAPQFGTYGLVAFVLTIPWRLALIGLILLALIHVLVKRFAFSYHRPFLYTIIGVLVFTFVSALFIAQTSTHDQVRERMADQPLPLLASLYDTDRPAELLTFGTVVDFVDDTYVLETATGEMLTVVTTKRTRVPRALERNTQVVVLGERIEDTITARGIRPADQVPGRVRALREQRQSERLNGRPPELRVEYQGRTPTSTRP